MKRKFARTGIAALVLGSIVMVGSGSPAQAKPDLNTGTEYITTYWSNAQHTTFVGERVIGYGENCQNYSYGSTSAYATYSTNPCE
jgi:hypothetical protein